jgi:hypothetical protein
MSQRKLIRYGIVPLTALTLFIAAGYYFWTRGVYVRITNSTQSTLKHIDVAYSGGVIHITELAPGASHGQYVNPSWESDLALEWSDSLGVRHSHTIGVYIEHNYAGNVEITVGPNNKVSVTDKVRLTLLPENRRRATYSLLDDENDVK